MTDCGWRPPKRPVRVGTNSNLDTCDVPAVAFNPTSDNDAQYAHDALCSDFSDDLLHNQDLQLRPGSTSANGGEQCGRGTQTATCKTVADRTIEARLRTTQATGLFYEKDRLAVETRDGAAGTLAYVNHRYHEKAAYINPNLAGQGACASPFNMLHNSDGHLVRPRMYPAHNRAMDSPLVDEYTVWFNKGVGNSYGNVLRDNMRLWVKEVCSDGGEGSVRVPMQFDVSNIDAGSAANADTKFFYDFACPYGSQPEACPARDGLREYQQTMDELEQPSGPAFANCFDEDVPDFECCHAAHEFRIHGGGGLAGHMNNEELNYCALPEPPAVTDREYTTISQWYTTTKQLMEDDSTDWGTALYDYLTLEECMDRCDNHIGRFQRNEAGDWFGEAVQCESINWRSWPYNNPGTRARCRLYPHDLFDYDGGFVNSCSSTHCQSPRDNSEDDYVNALDNYAMTLHIAINADSQRADYNEPCPLHWTSYHHTSTGCKAFCRAAFQREGNDNTCMPAKPECANWLDADDFPTEQYVTVDAECICGAKLEEYQDSGKYVHTGTVLQGTRARARDRALHEDDGVDDGPWGWPDVVSAGIDQFHGKTPITSLKHAHTHTHTRSPKHALFAGAHFDVGDACIAEIMSFRTDLLNGSDCDNYMDLTVADIPTEWDPKVTSSHVGCTEDGSTDNQCCLVHRGTEQASRLWTQADDMATNSVAESFYLSAIVGTAVHTSRVAAVGNFVRRFATFKP